MKQFRHITQPINSCWLLCKRYWIDQYVHAEWPLTGQSIVKQKNDIDAHEKFKHSGNTGICAKTETARVDTYTMTVHIMYTRTYSEMTTKVIQTSVCTHLIERSILPRVSMFVHSYAQHLWIFTWVCIYVWTMYTSIHMCSICSIVCILVIYVSWPLDMLTNTWDENVWRVYYRHYDSVLTNK